MGSTPREIFWDSSSFSSARLGWLASGPAAWWPRAARLAWAARLGSRARARARPPARPPAHTHARARTHAPAHTHARARAHARARTHAREGRVIGRAGSFPIDRSLSGLPAVRSRSIAGPPGPPDRLGLRRGPYDRSGSIGRDRTGHEPPGRGDRSGSIVGAPAPGAGHREKTCESGRVGACGAARASVTIAPGPARRFRSRDRSGNHGRPRRIDRCHPPVPLRTSP
jgi:hypothetical protein